MTFRHTAIRHLDAEQAIEGLDRMPDDIQPVYIGTGVIGLALDATGMQGLNTNIALRPEAASYVSNGYLQQRDLYLYRAAVISGHSIPQAPRVEGDQNFYYKSLMPNGYLDYTLQIDGQAYHTQDILQLATNWSRTFVPGEGAVMTSFTLGKVDITWHTAMGIGSESAEYIFEVASNDNYEHNIQLEVRFNFLQRNGVPLATGGMNATIAEHFIARVWEVSDETSSAPMLAPATINYALTARGDVKFQEQKHSISLLWSAKGKEVTTDLRLISGSDRTDHAEITFLQEEVTYFQSSEFGECFELAIQTWENYFDRSAQFDTGEPTMQFITTAAQYYLKAGESWRWGVEMSTLWTNKFSGATFWDGFFASDGMLRMGDYEAVRQFCKYLLDSAQSTGRPHYWITWYDGTPGIIPETDLAYQNVLAYAQIFIRLYRYSNDQNDRDHLALPYLKLLVKFLLDEVVDTAKPNYPLKGTTAHDVGVKGHDADEDSVLKHWVIVPLVMYSTLMEEVGRSDSLTSQCDEIRDYFTDNPVQLDKGTWYAWLPHLTNSPHLMTGDRWRERMYIGQRDGNNRALTNVTAWGCCVQASSLYLMGMTEAGMHMHQRALIHTSGLGQLTELPFEDQEGGNSPYLPSSGAWLSASCLRFASGSLWSNDVEVGTNLPMLDGPRHMSWKNIRTANNATISGQISGDDLITTIQCDSDIRLTLVVPIRLRGDAIHISCNDQSIAFEIETERRVVLELPAGKHEIELTRKVVEYDDVLLIEPYDLGAAFKGILQGSGRKVRWVRDLVEARRAMPNAKTIVLVEDYLGYGPVLGDVLAKAVEAGAHLITFRHAATAGIDAQLAKLVGVNAVQIEDWVFDSKPAAHILTEDGKQLLSELPSTLDIPVIQAFKVVPEADVKILARHAEEGWPTVTQRRVGQGKVTWLGFGGRYIGFTPDGRRHNMLADMFFLGNSRDAEFTRPWLSHEDTKQLLKALVK